MFSCYQWLSYFFKETIIFYFSMDFLVIHYILTKSPKYLLAMIINHSRVRSQILWIIGLEKNGLCFFDETIIFYFSMDFLAIHYILIKIHKYLLVMIINHYRVWSQILWIIWSDKMGCVFLLRPFYFSMDFLIICYIWWKYYELFSCH